MPPRHWHRAWVVTVDMGYGHQRATFPLKDIVYKSIIVANRYRGIPSGDRSVWDKSQTFYEAISRFKQVPLIGEAVFSLYDRFQEIAPFYPKRDLSKPTLPVLEVDRLIRSGWGKHLVQKLAKKPLPLVTSFFNTALMADIHGYPGEIYCIICDADFSRIWVAKDPKKSRITYFAPNHRVVERLKMYGVDEERIILTGFPLPKDNVGNGSLDVLKSDIRARLTNLDPQRRYIGQYEQTMQGHLGGLPPKRSKHPFSIMFAVGGAGAQLELGKTIITSIQELIRKNKLDFTLVAGVRAEVRDGFLDHIRALGLERCVGKNLHVLYELTKQKYFEAFSSALHTTDVLWTKPSELCFYTALGLPIIIAPPVGSQEKFNKLWLKSLASGISQQDPRYTNEWLMDWLDSGWLAEAAMQGFLEAPRCGTANIENILQLHKEKMKEVRTVLQY